MSAAQSLRFGNDWKLLRNEIFPHIGCAGAQVGARGTPSRDLLWTVFRDNITLK